MFKLSAGVDHVVRHVWPLTKVNRSKIKVTRSRHETYQQLERYNSATEGRINFKLGENFHRQEQNIWHILDH